MIAAADRKKLRALLGERAKADQKALFALIRAHSDQALLAALAPQRKGRRKRDALLRKIDATMRPLLASSAEKAALLVDHVLRRQPDLAFTPKGLADAVRRLRAAGIKDARIRAAAKRLVADLARAHGRQEKVV